MIINKELPHEDSANSTCFTGLVDKYPDLARHLASNTDIVHCKDFEIAIVKIQREKETTFTPQEKRTVNHLLHP